MPPSGKPEYVMPQPISADGGLCVTSDWKVWLSSNFIIIKWKSIDKITYLVWNADVSYYSIYLKVATADNSIHLEFITLHSLVLRWYHYSACLHYSTTFYGTLWSRKLAAWLFCLFNLTVSYDLNWSWRCERYTIFLFVISSSSKPSQLLCSMITEDSK